MRDAGVRSVLTTPTLADFANPFGPPIVVDRAAAVAYGLDQNDDPFPLSSGGVESGTSFPLTPETSDLFFRTDRALLYYYTGVRWLTVSQYALPLIQSAAVAAKSASTQSVLLGVPAYAPTYDFWIDTFLWSSQVATTNDGTKYWDVKLTKYTDVTQATLATGSTGTAPDAITNFISHATAVGALMGATADLIAVDVTKVSTPGNLTLYGAAMVGRLVG